MNANFKFLEGNILTKYPSVSTPDVFTNREEEMKQKPRRKYRNQSKRHVDRELLHAAKGINPEDAPKNRNEEGDTNFLESDARDISDASLSSSSEDIKMPETSGDNGSVDKKEYFGFPVHEEWKARSDYNVNKECYISQMFTERAKCCDFIRRAQELTLKEIEMENDENLNKVKQSEPKQVQNADSFHMFKEKHIHSELPQMFNDQKKQEENSEMHRQNENSKAKKWNFDNSEYWLMHEPIPAYPPSKWTSPKDKMEEEMVFEHGLSMDKETKESIKGRFDGWKTLYESGLTNYRAEIPQTLFVDGISDIYSKINEKKIQDDQDELNVEKRWSKAKQLAGDLIERKLYEEEGKLSEIINEEVAGQADKFERQDVGEKHYIKEPGDYFKFSDAFKELAQTMKEIKENKAEFENENTFKNWITERDMKTKEENLHEHYEERLKEKKSDINEENLITTYRKFVELVSVLNVKKLPSFEEWRNCVTSRHIEEKVAHFKTEVMPNLGLSELKISRMPMSKDLNTDYSKFIKTIREIDQKVKEPQPETKMDDYNQIVSTMHLLEHKLKEMYGKDKQPEHLNDDFSFVSEEEKRAVEFRKDYDKDFKERRAWLDQQIKDTSTRMALFFNSRREPVKTEKKRSLLSSMSKTEFEQIKSDTKSVNNSEIKYPTDSAEDKCRKETEEAKPYEGTPEAKCNKEMLEVKPCVDPLAENRKNRKEYFYTEKRNGIMTDSIMDRISGYFEKRLAKLLAEGNEEHRKESEEAEQKKSHEDAVIFDWISPDIKIKMCY